MLGQIYFGSQHMVFSYFFFLGFSVGERLLGSPEERGCNYQHDPNSPRLCFVASLSLYDLYGFIGKHKDFQELLASQTHLCFLVGTGFYFPIQLKLVCRSLELVNVKLMLRQALGEMRFFLCCDLRTTWSQVYRTGK